ncbi:MAG TPA: hypothetical protein VGN34_29775, partial [Ktedonobacteraceae bacterium]
GRWSLAPSPAFTDNPALTAMSAEDNHDIWAAACEPTSAGVRQAFFLHWNGAGWRRVDIPRIVHRDVCYTTIKAEPHAQVVALGTSGNGNDLTDGRPVIAQFNGRTWDVRECLFMGGFTVGSAAIVNSKNIWAVRSNARGLQTVEHWNGYHWQMVPMFPPEGHTYNLKALDVACSTVWVVGTDGYNRVAKPLAMYWSGQKWTMTALPVIDTQMHYELIAVKIFSSEDVQSVEWDGYGEVFLDHWNGREWSISGQTPI